MKKENIYSVYKLTSPENKVYIGCTRQNPKDRWNYGNKYHHNKELSSDIKKFGWDSFEHIVLYSGLEEDEAFNLEKELIHKYNSNDPIYGYNKCTGGKINAGMIRSDIYRRKISERVSGDRHPFYGKHLSEEHRRKISKSNMGHLVSEETRRKIGEGNSKNSSCKRRVLCVDTGIIYNSLNDAAKFIGTPSSNIGSVCRGKTKTAGGCSWKYVD